MKINYITLKKIILFTFLVFFINSKSAYSEILKKIDVTGNDRLAKETVILFSELNVNDDVSSEDLNNAFKNLYETDYFKNIKISLNKGILKNEVEENPIIQSVIIKGIKNKSILSELNKITKKIEK